MTTTAVANFTVDFSPAFSTPTVTLATSVSSPAASPSLYEDNNNNNNSADLNSSSYSSSSSSSSVAYETSFEALRGFASQVVKQVLLLFFFQMST